MCIYKQPFYFEKEYWRDHIQKLELDLNKLKDIGLKFNIENYFFWGNKNGIFEFPGNSC